MRVLQDLYVTGCAAQPVVSQAVWPAQHACCSLIWVLGSILNTLVLWLFIHEHETCNILHVYFRLVPALSVLLYFVTAVRNVSAASNNHV